MKKLILLLLCAVLLMGMAAGTARADSRFCPWCGQEYSADQGFSFCPNCGRELPKIGTSQAEEQETSSAMSIGDIVLFGSYEQDNDTNNGQEEIEWIVLDVQEGKALLISRYALDSRQYNSSRTDITWEECTLRTWLNDEFLNAAFSTEEQEQILTSKVTADKNLRYSTDPGNDTMDQIFLLSFRETNEYFVSESEKECKPTEYAEAHGCYANSDNGNVLWWLRSPGYYADYAASVNSAGSFNVYGYYVDSGSYAIRPALWIILES